MSTVRIDLTPYTKEGDYMGYPYRTQAQRTLPRSGNEGRKAALAEGFAEKLKENDVVVIVLNRNTRIHQKHEFMESFLKVGLKAVGVEEMKKKLTVRDEQDDFFLGYVIREFIGREEDRQKRAAERKRKEDAKSSAANWTDPVQFFLPEIGTAIRLASPWHLKLYNEYRNDKLIELVGAFSNVGSWYRGNNPKGKKIIIKADAELTVDRIYIRKGAEEFSSLSFWLSPGAEVIYDGTTYTTKKKIRFWAKLVDVNKISALISKASMPGM